MMDTETQIHPTAIIYPGAKLAAGVSVGPHSVIGSDVHIKENTKIGCFCLIEGRAIIGRDCHVFSGAVVGSIPQDKKFKTEEETYLEIGDRNIIREYVTINPGTGEGGKTIIGHDNLFMAYSHIAHDCLIGNHCVVANSGTLAGHVTLEDRAVVGGLTAIHQFVRLGKMCIVGGCSKVVQDTPPFSLCDGHPVKVYSLNLVGLKRAKMSPETIKILRKAFKILFFSGLTKKTAVVKIQNELSVTPEIEHLITFINTSRRGLCR